MDLITAMTAVGHALDAAKKLRDMEKDFDAATFRLEISNLMLALADAKEALAETKSDLADMREQLSRADAEIARLAQVQSGKMPVVQYRGYNFGIDQNGHPIGLPFCRTCEQRKGEQNQLSQMGHDTIFCSVCKTVPSDAPTALPHNLWPSAS